MKFDRNLFGRKWVGYALAGCATVLFYMIISHLHVFGGVIRKIGGYVNPVHVVEDRNGEVYTIRDDKAPIREDKGEGGGKRFDIDHMEFMYLNFHKNKKS